MTTYQRSANVLVAIKRETTTGVAVATVTGATEIRILDSPGLELKRAPIKSAEKRTDLLESMPRLGFRSVDGSYNTEATVGGHTDLLLEAVMRGAWAAATNIGFGTMTTVAIGTNALTAAGGSWFTQGLKIGDIFTLASTTNAADNSLNTRVVALGTLTITVATGVFTTLAATATGTLTILKKLTNPATPNRYSHNVEQYDGDTDLSELFLGVRAVGAKISCKPGAPVTIVYTFMGMDRTALATNTSPFFSSPILTTGLALVCEDSTLRYNGALVAAFTGFDLDFTITSSGQPVISSTVSPDIFDDNLSVMGTIAGLRSDFSNLTLYDAETEFDVAIQLEEPNTGPPKSCLGIFLPRVKIGALSAPVGGGNGAKIESHTLMVGPKVATTSYDAGVAVIHSSAS